MMMICLTIQLIIQAYATWPLCRKFRYRFEELLKEPKAFAACALNTNWW